MNYPDWIDLVCPYCEHKEDEWVSNYTFNCKSFCTDADGCEEIYDDSYEVDVYFCPSCKKKIQAHKFSSFTWYLKQYRKVSLMDISKTKMLPYGWQPDCFFLNITEDDQFEIQLDIFDEYYCEQSLNLVIEDNGLINWDKTLAPIKPPPDLWTLLI